MRKKKRLKKGPIITLVLLILIVIGGISIKKYVDYINSYKYKLKKVGYNTEQIEKIEKLKTDTIDYILTLKKDNYIVKLIDQKYFIESNLKKYLKYKKTAKKDITDTVAIVNVGADSEWYTNTKKSDTSLNELMLTNKFYYLDKTYNADKMVKVSNTYSYGNDQMLTEDTFNAFKEMWEAAKSEGLSLIINSSFRSYEDQEEVYEYYKATKGEEAADLIAAHAGFSEHQTGMAIDIQTRGSRAATFEEFDEFKWLEKNAYKYGFILRYPKDKEYLTGYEYESWHFRYVGKEVAKYIQENKITFDEYYAYFIEAKNEKEKKN